MRATYHKLHNIIIVELSEQERTKYLQHVSCREELQAQSDGDTYTYTYTIPCTRAFYLKSQRQRGGVQPWDKEQLRQGVRAAIANHLLPAPDSVDQEAYTQYKREWQNLVNDLHRNVRLLFPSSKHPRQQLTPQELQFKRKWRRKHRLR